MIFCKHYRKPTCFIVCSYTGILILATAWTVIFILLISKIGIDEMNNDDKVKLIFLPHILEQKEANPHYHIKQENSQNNWKPKPTSLINSYNEIKSISLSNSVIKIPVLKFENASRYHSIVESLPLENELENESSSEKKIKLPLESKGKFPLVPKVEPNNKPSLKSEADLNNESSAELKDDSSLISKADPNNESSVESKNESSLISKADLNNESSVESKYKASMVSKSESSADSLENKVKKHKYFSTIYPLPQNPDAPGENGNAVNIDQNQLNDTQKADFKRGWAMHKFNLMASDLISVRRKLRDRRTPKCKTRKYPYEQLPTTSVVIIFHNEAWSTLLRTVHSIIDRSPPRLLKEIVLVDDASTFSHLGEPLAEYMSLLKIVRIKRTRIRIGLIKSRMLGAADTTGDVLTFLDAHIECYPGWLEPLLSRIVRNPRAVALPVIDSISDNDFGVNYLDFDAVGIFDWDVQFNWRYLKAPNPNQEPVKSPAMAGGLLSIKRSFFYDLGNYDYGMEIWGSENVEMSLRVWMCGGILEKIPCSHVGHVFRAQPPYKWGGDVSKILVKNQRRVVEVWFGRHKELFYALNPEKKKYQYGNVEARIQLKERLHCKNFSWYLENVFPELFDPLQSKFLGSIKSKAYSDRCFDVSTKNSRISLFSCHYFGLTQNVAFDKYGCLRSITSCPKSDKDIDLVQCDQAPPDNKGCWKYDRKTYTIHFNRTLCITAKSDSELQVQPCQVVPPDSQIWMLKSLDEHLVSSSLE